MVNRELSPLVRVYPTSRHRWSPDQRACSSLSYAGSWP